MSFEKTLGEFRTLIDQRLGDLLPDPTSSPGPLHEAMRYSALAPGKRLRPCLCLAAAIACGAKDLEAVLDGACSLELVHCFSLIHDDLPAIDDDDLRRGRPTCHKVFGEALAILAGDALFALAFQVCLASHSNPQVTTKLGTILATASGSAGLVGGEVLDILSEGKKGDIDLLQTIHARKTGSLIEASCSFGAILAQASEASIQACGSFGKSVGLAFQIHDDILNETSTSEELGKAVGSDKERNKLTYPALLGLKESERLANKATQEALESLSQLPGDTELLRNLCLYSVQRKS
ncbi:MAG: polyprenyl synthetase family protein [Fimbriimonadaceae bacterium]|nr:polyprenyl synthetase family protein [Fimbriimonadaceae bacterium]